MLCNEGVPGISMSEPTSLIKDIPVLTDMSPRHPGSMTGAVGIGAYVVGNDDTLTPEEVKSVDAFRAGCEGGERLD